MTTSKTFGNTAGNPADTPSLRDHIAKHLHDNWDFATPILWENTPPPAHTPKSGWLRFRLRHGSTTAAAINGSHRFRRGSVRFEVAVAAGEGAADLDRMLDALTTLFANTHIGGAQFGRLRASFASHDQGYAIASVDASFVYPLHP